MSREEQQALAQRPASILQVIATAVTDPRMDVDKMRALFELQRDIVAEERRTAFMAAMARLAPKLPEVKRLGTSHHGKYAKLEDIDRAIRPLLAEEGFSLSFDSAPSDKNVRITCKLSHAEGHSESKTIDLPIDNSGSKNGAQAIISTVSYGRRALVKMFFNLMEAGEDTDGNDPSAISEDQATEIRDLIRETKSNEKNFLELIAGVERIEDIPAKDYKRIKNALETKKRVSK